MSEEIRIYVADLAAYNNGKLHGVWIDATRDINDIQARINTMLAESPEGFVEEYAIHDYEGFGGYSVGEYEGIQSLHEIACFITEYPDLAGELLSHFGGHLEDARKAMEESYSGCYKSLADYAEELTDDASQIPENLAYYVDYARMGRDMELNGDIYTIKTSFEDVHVFHAH